MSRISVIIPTLNEERSIERTLRNIVERQQEANVEVIVADGGSVDQTQSIAARYAQVITCPQGRANQLNAAATHANGDILFFVHADMELPPYTISKICEKVFNEGYDGGGFSNVFSNHNRLIKSLGRTLNLRFWDNDHSRNTTFFGDNGIFVKRTVFEAMGGFREIPIMEDYDFSRRLAQNYRSVRILNPKLIVSPRRHEVTGFIRTRLQWILIKRLFQLGVSPFILDKFYKPVR